jgi:hypothetical protein
VTTKREFAVTKHWEEVPPANTYFQGEPNNQESLQSHSQSHANLGTKLNHTRLSMTAYGSKINSQHTNTNKQGKILTEERWNGRN